MTSMVYEINARGDRAFPATYPRQIGTNTNSAATKNRELIAAEQGEITLQSKFSINRMAVYTCVD